MPRKLAFAVRAGVDDKVRKQRKTNELALG
jgi:hypothetical protein